MCVFALTWTKMFVAVCVGEAVQGQKCCNVVCVRVCVCVCPLVVGEPEGGPGAFYEVSFLQSGTLRGR